MIKVSQSMSLPMATLLSLLILIGVAFLDLASGHLIFVLLYFLPLGTAAWFANRKIGLVVCLLSVGLWLVDYLRYDYHGWISASWDTAITFGIFVCYSLVLSALRTATDKLENSARLLEERVDKRTAQLRETNRTLLRTQDRLEMALKNTPVSMYTTDRNLRYAWVYHPLLPQAENAVGKTAESLLPSEEAAHLNAIRRQVMDSGIEVHEEMQFHIEGREIHWDMFFAPYRNDSGEVEGVTTLALDITDRKRAEDLLRNLNTVLERRAEQLRNLMIELTRTEERERRRIAQILHDHLQQILVGARFSAEALEQRASDPEKVRLGLERLVVALDEAIQASRSLTVELAPPVLYDKGLPEALHWLARWVEEKYGISVQVNTDERAGELDQELRVMMFQGIRELLFNVAKHARVKQATVTLCYGDDNMVAATIHDDGVGFDPDARKEESEGITLGGFGLFTIRERLAAIGGQLKIESAPGCGTTSTICVPVRPQLR